MLVIRGLRSFLDKKSDLCTKRANRGGQARSQRTNGMMAPEGTEKYSWEVCLTAVDKESKYKPLGKLGDWNGQHCMF